MDSVIAWFFATAGFYTSIFLLAGKAFNDRDERRQEAEEFWKNRR